MLCGVVKTALHRYTKLVFFYGNLIVMLNMINLKGHNVNVQDNDGETPLHITCKSGPSDAVEALMLAGADETMTNNERETSAQRAEKAGHTELLKLWTEIVCGKWMSERRKNNVKHFSFRADYTVN